MARIVTGSLLIVVGAAGVFAQQPAPKDTPPTCDSSKSYNKNGWTVPGVDGAKVTQHAAFTNIPDVFVTILQPLNAETNMTKVSCSRDHSEWPAIEEDIPIKILRLWFFDIDGHVFAYRVEYACEVIENGERLELGCASSAFFYDNDGLGRFTLTDSGKSGNGKGFGFLPSFIPEWVKVYAKAVPAQ